ncbi:LuxR family transcriptional regulator [Sphingobacterium kitahiroshimense]|uniref:LuxR C-terminal-related transcriptional regulator n=1 Tax=Sphingobacterium sp. B16(2022) TaxID=2914044 RepID=UPI00143B116E|nr:LuxR C-terminal-related transcriptional regulator [Sphingobacterium sp. B16(2022)]NJI75437.1 LuxR family transcriptional regulator [Sphingobacterium sp. B16(2022)]
MEQKKTRHLLSDLWDSYEDVYSKDFLPRKKDDLTTILADVFVVGPYYSYVIYVPDSSLLQVSESTLRIHGLSDYPVSVADIIDQIHPDDLDFVLMAEKATLEKMKEIGFNYQLYLKSSYCFRMRIADGSYHMFHHQAIHLNKDEDGRLITALNIHTDIQHITCTNNKIVLVTNIGTKETYFCQIDLSLVEHKPCVPELTKREREILSLIAKGHSSTQIAESLFISPDTVRTHRKNLFRKSNVNCVAEFVRKCIEWGLLQLIYFYTIEL